MKKSQPCSLINPIRHFETNQNGGDIKLSNSNKIRIYDIIWLKIAMHVAHTKVLTQFIDQHQPNNILKQNIGHLNFPN